MNILIVDDQTWVLTGLRDGIHWKELNVQKVFTAESADAAKEIYRENRIDIIITDIEMPGENGLSLLRWVKEQGGITEAILLTSHAEFDYAREGLILGCTEYILQPARYETIEEAVRRVAQRVEEKTEAEEMKVLSPYRRQLITETTDRLLQKILHGCSNPEEVFQNIASLVVNVDVSEKKVILFLHQIIRKKNEDMDDLGIRYSAYNVQRKLLIPMDQAALQQRKFLEPKHTIFLQGKADERIYALFLLYPVNDKEDKKYTKEEMERKLGNYLEFEEASLNFESAFCYIGEIPGAASIPDYVEKGKKVLRRNVLGERKIFELEEEEEKTPSLREYHFPVENWGNLFAAGEGSQVLNCVKGYFEEALDRGEKAEETAQLLRRIHQAVIMAAYQAMAARKMDFETCFGDRDNFQKILSSYDSYDHLLKIIDYFSSRFSCGEEENSNENGDDQVEQAMLFIRDHLDKHITRTDVAEYVHINEDYLTKMFKARTGIGLKEYINREKLELAKELLISTNISVSLIALKTGFSNFSHFSQAFKKTIGISPSEFREKYQNGKEN